jgi:FMN-dependent NADH-azoreductase
MATILHINSSVRSTGSISRQLSGEFLRSWLAVRPTDVIVTRDLAANPVPHLNDDVMQAFFTAAELHSPEQSQAVQLSNDLVAELLSADTIVLGAPMYNFSVSSTLKAWIDHVTRAGLTFKYTSNGPIGLVQGKKMYVFTSRGGVYSRGPAKAMDFHETYLRAVLGFIGLTEITFIHTEGLAMGESAVADALTRSRQTIRELVSA